MQTREALTRRWVEMSPRNRVKNDRRKQCSCCTCTSVDYWTQVQQARKGGVNNLGCGCFFALAAMQSERASCRGLAEELPALSFVVTAVAWPSNTRTALWSINQSVAETQTSPPNNKHDLSRLLHVFSQAISRLIKTPNHTPQTRQQDAGLRLLKPQPQPSTSRQRRASSQGHIHRYHHRRCSLRWRCCHCSRHSRHQWSHSSRQGT